MVASGITAPELSCTVPLISPVIICAEIGCAINSITMEAHRNHLLREVFLLIS
jgi:hypothetical protein